VPKASPASIRIVFGPRATRPRSGEQRGQLGREITASGRLGEINFYPPMPRPVFENRQRLRWWLEQILQRIARCVGVRKVAEVGRKFSQCHGRQAAGDMGRPSDS
jgi:hypothetical protein